MKKTGEEKGQKLEVLTHTIHPHIKMEIERGEVEPTVVAFVTDLPHFALNDPSYSPYDVTYDVIGNPH